MDDTVDEIALGLTRNLPAFRKIVPQAQNYVDLHLEPYIPGFADRIYEKMLEAKRIHFDLTEMHFLNTPVAVLTGPKHILALGSTNWELRTIWDDPALLAKTAFYRNGKILSVEEVLKLH